MGTRSLGRLSARKFESLSRIGRHCDGGGLYLQIGAGGSRSWVFRFQLGGRIRDMGLGSAKTTGLADARLLASECRALVAKRLDPIEQKARTQRAQAVAEASAVTFEQHARRVIESKKLSWRSSKHAAQWERSLEAHVFPKIGSLPIGTIDTHLVLEVLEPIWQNKYKTAFRIRERIETILDAAKARSLRYGENPARWRGHLETLLSQPQTAKQVRHHPALPYSEISAFVKSIRNTPSTASRAMEFLILTATRTNEVINARWEEIDRENAVWTIPASRTKTAKEHKVPLPPRRSRCLRPSVKSETAPMSFQESVRARLLATWCSQNYCPSWGVRISRPTASVARSEIGQLSKRISLGK